MSNRENHRLYSTWKSMRNRCNNPNTGHYKYYGGKGVRVCKEWNDFNKFVQDMYPSFEEGKTLDRKDTNGDYSFDNCKWSTFKEQANNQGREYTKILYNGTYFTEAELSEVTGLPRTTLQARRLKGYSDIEIVGGRSRKKYLVSGEYFNLKELANFLGTTPQNLHQRLKNKSLGELLLEFNRI